MKIAVFSDIHGNKHAFFKALELMKNYEIEKYFFCGDICGYYYYHNEIIDVFRKMRNLYCILGNHDKIFLDILYGKLNKDQYTNRYGSSIEKFLSNITQENLSYMKNLKTELYCEIDKLKIAMFHGTPWNNLNGYCYPDYSFSKYYNLKYNYIFQGHTHYRMHKKVGNLNIVNPGSLGQPRDGKLPSFAVFDTIEKTIEFISVPYDVDNLINEVKKNIGEPIYLIEILRGSGND